MSSVASKHYCELEGEKAGGVWGTIPAYILAAWVLGFLKIFHPVMLKFHPAMQLLVSARFKLLPFYF